MKINIEIDMTAEEAKKMVNLPDMSGIVEEQIKEQISKAAKNNMFDPSNWFNPNVFGGASK